MESYEPPRRLSSISPISPLSSQISFRSMPTPQQHHSDHDLASSQSSQRSVAPLIPPMPHPPPARMSKFLEGEDTTTAYTHGQQADPLDSPRTFVNNSQVPSMGNISRLTTLQDSSDGAGKAYTKHATSDSGSDNSSRYSPTHGVPRSCFDPMEAFSPPNRHVPFDCPTRGDIVHSRHGWLPRWLLALSFLSIIASAAAVFVAHKQVAYRIGRPGNISLASATSICAVLAKLVEIMLVTLVVTILGQSLSRKLISQEPGAIGVNIAELNMRAWITQPGTIFTNLTSTFRMAHTLLGAIALWTMVVSLLYTTAAEALIYPKLRMRDPIGQKLYATVETSFANHAYMKQNCKTPIIDVDADTSGTACLHISFAGQSFHNFQSYLDQWATLPNEGSGMDYLTLDSRPRPEAVFDVESGTHDSQKSAVAVTGQWLTSQSGDITINSTSFGRFVQNVTMVMPHINVAYAARDPINDITQPEDLGGFGEYNISAAVPAPAVHVLCAGLTAAEATTFEKRDEYDTDNKIKTAVDDIFNFGTDAARGQQLVPRFEGLPKDYQTSMNNGTIYPYGASSAAAYLMGKPPKMPGVPEYVLCAIRASQYPHCTTKYHVADAGSQLTLHCDDDYENNLQYSNFDDAVVVGRVEPNFQDVAEDWIMATALNGGTEDMKAQSARLLMQMIPTQGEAGIAQLSRSQPSIAEALAVLAARPLLMSTVSAPFVPFWNYTAPGNILPDGGQQQHFNALVAMKVCTSGPSQSWQKMLFVVLWSALCISMGSAAWLSQIYFMPGGGNITDFTEPQNLFALAINSPPCISLQGACGAGPEGDEWQHEWKIKKHQAEDGPNHGYPGGDARHPHLYLHCLADDAVASGRLPSVIKRKPVRSSMRHEYQQVMSGESPALQQFERLSKSSGSVYNDLWEKIGGYRR